MFPTVKAFHTSLCVFRLFLKVNSLFLSIFVHSLLFFSSLGLHAVVSHFPFVPFLLLFLLFFLALHHLPILFQQHSLGLYFPSNCDFFFFSQLFLSYLHPFFCRYPPRTKLFDSFSNNLQKYFPRMVQQRNFFQLLSFFAVHHIYFFLSLRIHDSVRNK